MSSSSTSITLTPTSTSTSLTLSPSSSTSTSSSPYSQSTCDTQSIAGNTTGPQSVLDQGPTCYWKWPASNPTVDFSHCCAPNATVMTTDVCTDYCVVPPTSTDGSSADISSFNQCLVQAADLPRETVFGIVLCKRKGEAGRRYGRGAGGWAVVMALSVLGVTGIVGGSGRG